MWIQTYSWLGRDGKLSYDSLTLDARTLRPITEQRSTKNGAVRVTYAGANVVATITSTGGAPRKLHTTLIGPAYSSSEIDALARTLPFAVGARLSVPLYYPFPAPVTFGSGEYEAIGTERTLGRGRRLEDCWLIQETFPDGLTRYWVNKSTREIVRIQSGEGSDAVIFFR